MPRLSTFRADAAQRAALARVKAWTRARFDLREEDALTAAELACALPGCPPLETVIVFWPQDERRRFIKIFKPVTEVTEDDLPPRWMMNALVREESDDCC